MIPENPWICNFKLKGWSWYFRNKSPCRHSMHYLTIIHGPNKLPRTWVQVLRFFMAKGKCWKFQENLTRTLGKFFVSRFMTKRPENSKRGEHDRILLMLKLFRLFSDQTSVTLKKDRRNVFYFKNLPRCETYRSLKVIRG